MIRAPRVCLGAFAGAHGVRGETKVRTFTAREDGVAAYGPVESEDGRRRFALSFIRVLKPGIALAAAPEITSREDAEALAGVRLFVDRAALPPPAAGEFYIDDLIGLAAIDTSGQARGRVVALYNFGAGDILELEAADGGLTMIPFSDAAAPAIDLAAGTITIAAERPVDDAADAALVAEAMRQEDA